MAGDQMQDQVSVDRDAAGGLGNADLVELIEFRRELHRAPELSGEEVETAARVVDFLQATAPDQVLTGLGGTGVAVVYAGSEPGPTVMLRAELDGLPIEELGQVAHKSRVPGKGHLCGHDGHMTILCAAARLLARNRPARGRVVLLFQPAEETGYGAQAVLDDPAFAQITPDIAFSLHNLPGLPLGHVALLEGPANCASRGLEIALEGKTAHASMPETGVSPMGAVAALVPQLTALGSGGPMAPGFRLVTLTHARVGEAAFGVAPGSATMLATLRCLQDADMQALCAQAEALVQDVARAEGLGVSLRYSDVFHACTNAAEPVRVLRAAFAASKVPVVEGLEPMRWSEDFGLFTRVAPSAMFLLGSGEAQPQLHNPDYDFPDDLIAVGARIFECAVRQVLG